MKIDFLIAASATPAFFSQIAFARMALNRLGGDYEKARLAAVFGHDGEPDVPDRWKPHLSGVDSVFVEPSVFRQHGTLAQVHGAMNACRTDADFVVYCDADVVVVRPFDELLRAVGRELAL